MTKMAVNRCRNCAHCVWGYSTTGQKSQVKVCALRPKRVRSDTSPHPRQYYYSTQPYRSCNDFSPRKEVAHEV